MNINRVTLQHNKEFIMFIFYFKMVLRAAFWGAYGKTGIQNTEPEPETETEPEPEPEPKK